MITSPQNEKIKELMKLKQKKYRDEHHLFLIEGEHLVQEALRSGCLEQVISMEDVEWFDNVLLVSKQVIEKLASTKTPQNIIGVCRYHIKNSFDPTKKRYVLLDNVQDPGNLGTMIRTCLGFGVDQMILSDDCVDLYNDKVLRSTQGALFELDVIKMDLKKAITELKNQDTYVCALALHQSKPIDDVLKQEKMAFVFGNEGQGIREEIIEICDQSVIIPIETVESLNVAIACAVTTYHFKS